MRDALLQALFTGNEKTRLVLPDASRDAISVRHAD